MNIAVKSQGAGWIIDQIVNDYKKYSRHNVVPIGGDAEIAWYVNLFGFNKLVHPKNVVYVHHINETSLNSYNFKLLNKADACVVPSLKSKVVAEKYLNIPIHHFPQWMVSSCLEERNEDRIEALKNKVGREHFLIGSFIKDGNGKKGGTPKLVKDPDKFISVVKKINETKPVKVILAGYARDYTISKLKENNISFEYFKRYPNIGDLYDLVDCYLVTSKVEGGPQSVYEASYRKVKILSTDVGVASEVLHPSCLCETVDDFVNGVLKNDYEFEHNYNKIIKNHMYNKVIPTLDDFFEELTRRE